MHRVLGEIGFYITQLLSGHGEFEAYLQRIGRRASPLCRCCDLEDSVEHTIYQCQRWDVVKQDVGLSWLSPEETVPYMLIGRAEWDKVLQLATSILKTKAREAREWDGA
ncbi:uncharacterized protein LOC142322717 [Lycorma delicatula]|uniref:uncharacterized protein LOC142322717 n=1 Tax=Lycorma delicatula TaxID=130591 RepID=UPI003F510782